MAGAPNELIAQIPLFAGLDKKELKAVGGALKDRSFKSGSAVVEAGATGVGFFVIESGTATVSVGDREVRTLGPGDHFGEIALIADTPRTATITASSDLACYGMTPWDFKGLVEKNGKIAWKLMHTLAKRLIEAEQHDS